MFKERIKTHHSAMADTKQYLEGFRSVGEVLGIENKSEENNAVIYIHVPFCRKICSFCNMRRSLRDPEPDYADWIIEEIKNYAKLPYIQTTVFDAVYFGGGTPTTLEGGALSGIIRALKESFRFTSDAEFSIETTVTELTEEKMAELISAGANRFSVGIQTFDDAGRMLMGRIGDGKKAYERLQQLKSHQNVTVSMDLIYNYPEQTMESLYQDLENIVSLDLDGFSLYSLINMKETRIEQAQAREIDEHMFYIISEYMKKEGYRFLELTKMVKRDSYKYIMNRHKGADTLPLGAGAGGSIGGLAMMNPIDLNEYKEGIREIKFRKGMYFLPQYKEIVRFKGDIQTIRLPRNEKLYRDRQSYGEFFQELLNEQMVVCKGEEYRLTDKGIYWGNTISRQLADLL